MKMTVVQAAITVIVVVAATMLTRFLPYILFPEGKKVPKYVIYLGQVLGPAVFGLLVVYCLRNVQWISAATHGIPEIIGVVTTTLVYKWRRQMILSMALGTAIYMILIRVM
jgi:branched-subunit amino acid transport protein AzlD